MCLGVKIPGLRGRGKRLDSVEKYDPILNKWTFEKSLPTGRNGLIAVSFNDMIFVLGGQYFDDSGRHPTDLNEIFHIGKHESNEVIVTFWFVIYLLDEYTAF